MRSVRLSTRPSAWPTLDDLNEATSRAWVCPLYEHVDRLLAVGEPPAPPEIGDALDARRVALMRSRIVQRRSLIAQVEERRRERESERRDREARRREKQAERNARAKARREEALARAVALYRAALAAPGAIAAGRHVYVPVVRPRA